MVGTKPQKLNSPNEGGLVKVVESAFHAFHFLCWLRISFVYCHYFFSCEIYYFFTFRISICPDLTPIVWAWKLSVHFTRIAFGFLCLRICISCFQSPEYIFFCLPEETAFCEKVANRIWLVELVPGMFSHLYDRWLNDSNFRRVAVSNKTLTSHDLKFCQNIFINKVRYFECRFQERLFQSQKSCEWSIREEKWPH